MPLKIYCKINGMNLGASPEPCSDASVGELYPTFSPAFAETKTRLCAGRSAEVRRLTDEGGLNQKLI